MPLNLSTGHFELSDKMEKLIREKRSSAELQERKHRDWDDNYELYRNKVKTNRLTQRQAVNIPLMKETIKTLLSKIDDRPDVDWKELGGDELKELFYQELWNDFSKTRNLETIDIVDKKNVLLYGSSWKKLNIDEKGVDPSVLDIYDILVDPLMKPWDLETARFIIHQNIFRTVREILADDRYSKEAKEELKIWKDSPQGILQSQAAKEEWEKKMERLRSMGVDHGDFPFYAGGDVLVNLSEHYTREWNTKTKQYDRRVVVYADDKLELSSDLLTDLIGVDFWPFVMWAEDPETNDVYPDSVADLVRTPNKVLNVWFSQMIENRTLKNFQMHWYSPSQNYTPQTYVPGPGVMLPAPPGDDISKVIKPVEVSGLDDTFDAISALTNIVERGSGATAIEKGQSDQGEQTLGEIKILVGKAGERTIGMAKFYRIAWYEFAKKWDALMHANPPTSVKLFKISKSGKAFPKTLLRGDWKSEIGYEPIVRSTSEQEVEQTKGIQKFQFLLNMFPNNPALRKIAQKRALELVDITPEEMREIEEADKEMQEAIEQVPAEVKAEQAQAQPQQEDNSALVGGIQNSLNELATING